MANWFYYDANGQKQGPVSDQQLTALVAQGIIVPETQLETESGQKGLAGQIPSLQFPERGPRPTSQQSSEHIGVFFWLLDFAFQDLRLPVINLWACRIFYAICWINVAVVFLGTLGLIGFGLSNLDKGPQVLPLCLVYTIGLWLAAAVFIFAARLLCEWYIILFDWIVVTTQSARIYVDKHKKERE